MDVGGGPSMFTMDISYVHGNGGNSRSSKRSKTSLDALMKTMSETSRAKKARYHTKATSAEEHTMIECMSVLKNILVYGVQYGLAAERLISGKDLCSFFLLSNSDWQLEWAPIGTTLSQLGTRKVDSRRYQNNAWPAAATHHERELVEGFGSLSSSSSFLIFMLRYGKSSKTFPARKKEEEKKKKVFN
ncbi:hypothetical protein LguiA_022977 [Lonicera macranthoides]